MIDAIIKYKVEYLKEALEENNYIFSEIKNHFSNNKKVSEVNNIILNYYAMGDKEDRNGNLIDKRENPSKINNDNYNKKNINLLEVDDNKNNVNGYININNTNMNSFDEIFTNKFTSDKNNNNSNINFNSSSSNSYYIQENFLQSNNKNNDNYSNNNNNICNNLNKDIINVESLNPNNNNYLIDIFENPISGFTDKKIENMSNKAFNNLDSNNNHNNFGSKKGFDFIKKKNFKNSIENTIKINDVNININNPNNFDFNCENFNNSNNIQENKCQNFSFINKEKKIKSNIDLNDLSCNNYCKISNNVMIF